LAQAPRLGEDPIQSHVAPRRSRTGMGQQCHTCRHDEEEVTHNAASYSTSERVSPDTHLRHFETAGRDEEGETRSDAEERSSIPDLPAGAAAGPGHGLGELGVLTADDGGEEQDGGGRAGEPQSWRSMSYFDREARELVSRRDLDIEHRGTREAVTFSSGSIYTGQWQGRQRHGFGMQTWRDGTCYEGQWVNNLAEGQGSFTHSNGDRYVGCWRGNVAHGFGTFRNKKGMTYRGTWTNDVQDGHGVETWLHLGSQFEGEFAGGDKEGVGVYRWPDGSQYLGSWSGGCIDGLGVYIGNDGRWFKGCWSDSVMHGAGMYTWQDGKEYCGQYRFDQKEGFGMFRWPDGRKYTGFWKKGKQHGLGTYTTPDGAVQSAYWKEGIRIEPVTPQF